MGLSGRCRSYSSVRHLGVVVLSGLLLGTTDNTASTSSIHQTICSDGSGSRFHPSFRLLLLGEYQYWLGRQIAICQHVASPPSPC
ncbi:hypothetical protein VTN00DRAFT_3011 [Thermoascus crustaceus]|uniref:uncharacterized protein n=1 Tax=Thermoascus crustaceus TaxID=5088 RepID=UPI00374207EC